MATIPQSLPQPTPLCPEPAWEIALLYPSQGEWDESHYLGLHTNQLVELVDGKLEVLRMPSIFHQGIVRYLHRILSDFVAARKCGTAYFAPLPVRIRPRTFREPDIVYISAENLHLLGEKYVTVADLVMEVVSPDDESHKRDCQKKRSDYAEAGIQEYWIVDPEMERVTVLVLKDKQYEAHGEFAHDEQATSVLLPGFSADVSATLAAAKIAL